MRDVGALARMLADGASSAEREAASEAEQRRAAAEHAQAASDRAAASEQALTVGKARVAKLQQELQAKQQVRFAHQVLLLVPDTCARCIGQLNLWLLGMPTKDNDCNSKSAGASLQSCCLSCRSSHAPRLAIAAVL